ncbi:HNH endonuclease signature motif containing protein [Planotetraspora silvatica]|uniref:HNH endonuclease signature motif containing protein n=1 Tax=Planotetraspora silvatica TaxID=234614 RepID=UPI0031D705B1
MASLPPGVELAEALANIDERRVSGFDTVEVLKAAYRQLCHDRARFLAVLLEVGLREHFSGDSVRRLEVPDEFSPDEARAALVWSRRRADSTFELAWGVHRRLPQLGEAMSRGDLDEPRAAAFIRWTAGLTPQQAEMVCAQLVPGAGRLTVGALIEQIQRLVLAIDPEWAQKRYTEAIRRRRVVGSRNEDGTATVSGLDLPLDRAAAGCERIDDLARACKRAGDRRPIDHIRTDLFLGSLDGSLEALTDKEIVAHVLKHPFVDQSDDRSDDAGADHASRPTGRKPARSPHRDPASPRPDAAQRARPGNDRPRNDRPRSDQAESERPDPVQPEHAEPGSVQHKPVPGNGAGRAVREIRVELTTLLGLDEHPAEVPGWGIIHAGLAREMVSGMLAGEWRFAVCTDDGRLLYSGITRHRPCVPSERPSRDIRHSGIVELQITRSRLNDIVEGNGSLGLWTSLLTDLVHRTRRHLQATDDTTRSSSDVSADPTSARRRASAVLRRYVQMRGRCCSWPGCRMPATRTDQDHAADWAGGGLTTEDNLHLACRHDHRAKHDGGWRVTMPDPGVILWSSPLGHSYPTRLPPIMFGTLDPRPRDWPDSPPGRIPDDAHPLVTGLKPHSPRTSTRQPCNPQQPSPPSRSEEGPDDGDTQAHAPDPQPITPLLGQETDAPPF